MCCLRDLIDGAIEHLFVRLGWFTEAAEFADELQRRRADFFVRRGRFEVMQGLDVSAHSISFLALFTDVPGFTDDKYKICEPGQLPARDSL